MGGATSLGVGGVSAGGRRSSSNEHYLCVELQKLQKEKERLQHEQEAIATKEMLLNELVMQSTHSSSHGGETSVPPAAAATLGTGALGSMMPGPQHQGAVVAGAGGVETFLGSTSQGGQGGVASMDSHARQNSTDSGLGGMGTAYSLPRSPEDYYNNVEEMCVEETSSKLQSMCYGSTGGGVGGEQMLYTPHHRRDHMTSVSELTGPGMDSEQLMTSLSEDYLLMNKLAMQKDNSMSWHM